MVNFYFYKWPIRLFVGLWFSASYYFLVSQDCFESFGSFLVGYIVFDYGQYKFLKY